MKPILKIIHLIIGIVIAAVAMTIVFSGCTHYTCPTYSGKPAHRHELSKSYTMKCYYVTKQ